MRKLINLGACVAFVAALGCGDAGEIADCTEICNTHEDCVGDIDVTGCIDRCEDFADQGDPAEDRVAICSDCYDDLGCSTACNDTCAGIVPPL
jgi:hypothetical protein